MYTGFTIELDHVHDRWLHHPFQHGVVRRRNTGSRPINAITGKQRSSRSPERDSPPWVPACP